MWSDVRFEGLAFEQILLRPRQSRVRLHDQYAVVLVLSGVGIIKSGRLEYPAQPGSAFVVCPNQLWSARAGRSSFYYRTLYINRHKLIELAEQSQVINHPFVPSTGVQVLNREASEAARQVWSAFETCASLLDRVGGLAQLAMMVVAACKFGQLAYDEPRISELLSFLGRYSCQRIRNPRLADVVSLTPYHLIRVFRDSVGVPPQRYATLVRLRCAESLLRAGVSIADVAGRAGFCDQSHLSRCFRRFIGLTPGQYQGATFYPVRPVITDEKVMKYRLRNGERLLSYWNRLRSNRALRNSVRLSSLRAPHKQAQFCPRQSRRQSRNVPGDVSADLLDTIERISMPEPAVHPLKDLPAMVAVDGRPLLAESLRMLEYLQERARTWTTHQIVERIRAAALELEGVAASVSEKDIRRRPFPTKWHIADVVDHISQTQIRGAEELRHLLSGQRPPGPPVYEALKSGASEWAPWPTLLKGLQDANREMLSVIENGTTGQGYDSNRNLGGSAAEVTVCALVVTTCKLPDGQEFPQLFISELDWRQYALLQRLHLLDHRTQIRKLLNALHC